MYNPVLKNIAITKEDETYIAAQADEPTRNLFAALIISVIDTNGSADTITPGIGKQYIDNSQFFQLVELQDVVNNHKVAYNLAVTYERALNWDAVGRGKGGIAAAAIREAYRDKVSRKRECIVHTDNPATKVAFLREFIAELEMYKMIFSFWKANAENVIALAAAVMLKEGHHWDAQNQRPQRALLAALDQKDVFSDTDMRKLFYLAVHPYPLDDLMKFVTDDTKHANLNEAVRCRLKAPPAGTAGFIIAASGASNLKKEEFYKFASEGFKTDIDALIAAAEIIHDDPLDYHTMSQLFTKSPRKDLPVVSTECLALCIAYIKTCIKGSLASAPSLNKLADANARLVQKYNSALDRYVETRGADIAEMISAGESSYKKIERDERNADLIADAKVRAEMQNAAAAAAQAPHE